MNSGKALYYYANEIAEFTEDALLESRLMIQKATGLSRPVLLSHPERELSSEEIDAIEKMCTRRKTGYPLPYLLGEWEFYGHSFAVNPSVLIPRPETELLVDEASGWLKQHPDIRFGFDIGTGSGCIAISLLLSHPNLQMAAIDIKRDALHTACENARKHNVSDRFLPVQCSLYSAFSASPFLICANLPYIPTETCTEIEPARFEPISALDGGSDGFEYYRLLFNQLTNKINNRSLILCEIEYRQREIALQTAEEYFTGSSISVLDDLAGQPRILKIEF